MKQLKHEFLAIIKNKKILIPILAVMLVPVLYSGMFLWAFWDPYEKLEEIPVAVVNNDKGAVYNDEKLELGNELVDKLKEEPEFDWHFVDREAAEKGLKDEKYYMMIEIPKNFSEHATTLMDDTPKKLDLIYVPNESYNFLSSQIGETAMLHIEMALEEKITETYAETMFDKIKEVADGLEEASEATEELKDGAGELQNGSEELRHNLKTLAGKSIEFTNGVESAQSGSRDLANGSKKLSNGLNELNEGSGKLLNASKDVQKGTKELAEGIAQANNGLEEMRKKVPELVTGTEQVQDGLAQFQNELPKQMAQKINGQLEESSKAMNNGLSELENGVVNGLNGQLAPGLVNGISSAMADEIINSQKAQVQQISQVLLQNGVDEQTVATIVGGLQEKAPSKESLQNQIRGKLEPQVKGAINETTKSIHGGFAQYTSEVNAKTKHATAGLEEQIKQAVNPTFEQLQGGLTAINSGQKTLQNGVNQLADGTNQLKAGSNKLASGQNEYVDNMQLFSQKFLEAKSGSNDLATGAGQLSDGMNELKDGSSKLSDGSNKLADGSEKLTDGVGQLVEGTEEFNDKMHDAADEAKDVNSNEDTYNMMANPVDTKNEKINEVPNYGTGFAPYFLSLGLFVGALLMSIVFPLRDPAKTPRSAFSWFASKFGMLMLIGIAQALIADAILLFALKIEVTSIPLFILFSIITSLVFMSLIQFLVTAFGDPGRFVAIIILILQLTTSAGTFPLELIPNALQKFNAFLPMTYTVSGFKAVISSGNYAFLWNNILVLLVFIALTLIGTIVYFTIQYKRTFSKMELDEAV